VEIAQLKITLKPKVSQQPFIWCFRKTSWW